MTKRTDIHRETDLQPEEYTALEYYCLSVAELVSLGNLALLEEEMRKLRRIREMVAENGVKIHPGTNRCDHCGAHFKHGILYRHEPTGKLLTVGWQCASNRFDLDNLQYQRARIEKLVKAQRARQRAWRRLLGMARDGEFTAAIRGLARYRRHDGFLMDLSRQLVNRGKLTDRQWAAILPAVERVRERLEKRAAEDALPKVPVVVGNGVRIEGEVLTVKWQDSFYGGAMKMLVRDDRGFKVWGTLPRALDDAERGDHVAFTANVEASKDDETFGFFKRPRQATIAEAA